MACGRRVFWNRNGALSTLAMNVAFEFGFGANPYRAYQGLRLDRRLVSAGL
jgi:hypothetical protein